MPTATPFKAIGKGNGFPFCLETVDVLDRGDGNPYDHWVTLGGFKKTDTGSPTQSQIDTSLQNAMKLFWNAHQITGTASLDSSYNAPTVTNSRNPNTTQLQPSKRVCLSSEFRDDNTGSSTTLDGENFMQLLIIPVLLKSGNNFLGYGVRGGIYANSFTFAGEFASVTIGSIAAIYGPSSQVDDDYDYITLGGINFVCQASVTSSMTATADASNLVAYDNDYYTEIDSLDFYTY